MTASVELDRPRALIAPRWAAGLRADPTTRLVDRSHRRPWLRVPADLAAGLVAASAVHLLDPSSLPTPALALLPLGWVAVLLGVRAYDSSPRRLDADEALRVLRAGAVLSVLTLVVVSLGILDLRPHQMLALVATAPVATLCLRAGLAHAPAGVLRRSLPPPRVLVVGHRRAATGVVESLRRSGDFTVAGVCLPSTASTAGLQVPVVTGFERIVSAVAEHRADAVVVLPCRHFAPADLRRLGWRLEPAGTQLFVASGLQDVGTTRARLHQAGDLPLLHVRHAELGGARRVVKEVGDRLAAGLALLLVSPVLLTLALAVRLDSSGPALFRQVRVGKDGQTFTMFKLRTMAHDAEDRLVAVVALNESDGVLFKVREDPRVTRLGRLLRRSSLDELPQLLNVLLGHMSLVGPRPPLQDEVAAYVGDTHRRLAVKPGITGLWQVSGRSDLSWEESVRLDLRYVDNWSMTLDLLILGRTARAVLSRRGAY
ncbi:sugar transferase [Nocardioides psychrotolerans]|uniref:sugar transferase n=1 Tax=Nocardioides psychrotolerans TaxID=1005945 RepID=UPI003138497A